jgi:hypothetical protein
VRAAFAARVAHLVVERHRIVKRWLSERCDRLHGNGPAWSDPVKLAQQSLVKFGEGNAGH